MVKFLLRFFSILLIVIFAVIMFLSYFGLETNKFDSFIKNKANEINQNVKLEINKTKIYFDISELKLLLKLQKPKILVKHNEVDLSKLDLTLSLKSFYTSDFLLEKANVAFKRNDIKDLTKITNIFLPKIINKRLKKIFAKGNLEGEFIIPFKKDGNISKNYSFYGKVLEADINITKDYRFQNLNAEISYGENSFTNIDDLRITINKGNFLNLKLLRSIINIKFKKDKKDIKSTIHTKGDITSIEVKNILSLFGIQINALQDINLSSDLTTEISFILDNKFSLKDLNYSIRGDIKKLQIKLNETKEIKKFITSFTPSIILKDAKVNYKALNGNDKNQFLEIEGDAKFGKEFEKVQISQIYNKKKKEFSIIGSSTLTESAINISLLNYKKNKKEKANVFFNTKFALGKYFLIEHLHFTNNQSEIKLDKILLNKKFELVDLKSLIIKTFNNKVKNNDFVIKKLDQIVVKGEVFDAEPLLRSLYNKDKRKTFDKKFKNKIKINLNKAITGSDDDIYNFSMLASIINGSFIKLSSKGSFSDNEIIEMSIYQVNKDKKTVHLISDRARPFVKTFDFIKGFGGGKLEYESSIYSYGSASNLVITNFKVSKVPALAQILTLASLQGIADTLSGEGINFETFEMSSNTLGNVLNIEEAYASGPAVSILLDGYVDKGKIVSLRGTLVPARWLNSFINKIPIVGKILVGEKKGEGVVGVSFKLKGPPKDIKTTVNPIKTLTPRFIVRAVEKIKKNKKEKSK